MSCGRPTTYGQFYPNRTRLGWLRVSCHTRRISSHHPDRGADPPRALRRHHCGDWGEELCAEDKQANEDALVHGTRLLSCYRTAGGARLYIITEWDRSMSTLLLPEESIESSMVAGGRSSRKHDAAYDPHLVASLKKREQGIKVHVHGRAGVEGDSFPEALGHVLCQLAQSNAIRVSGDKVDDFVSVDGDGVCHEYGSDGGA